MIIILYSIAGFFVLATLFGYIFSGPVYTGPATENFDGKQFINPKGIKAEGLGSVFKWMINRKRGAWEEREEMPFGEKPLSRVDQGVRITFVNHSTFLIQVDGLNILTDPIWSKRTSPFSFAGPKRMRPPGIRFEDLPKIDVVLLSHNHYDHLDVPTMRKIFQTHQPKIVTPLGVKAFLDSKNISGAQDLNWWDEVALNDSVKIQAIPAQHFSGRGTFDRDRTLWCGYVIKRKAGNIYFAGDTGYNDQTFKEIGERCSPIDVALIPIGAYKPEWFMSPIHCSPAGAVQIHIDLKAAKSIGIHFGTFPLADDGQNDPAIDLETALRERGISKEQFLVPAEGKAYQF